MKTTDLHQYHLVMVSSSAGKDSQAMLTRIVELADAQGYARDRIVVAHADLGRVEWQGTRELAEQQAQHYGIRFVVVSRPQGDLLAHVRKRGMWPSPKARYCTSDHKRGQLRKVITGAHRDARAAGHTGTYRVLECIGLRAEESPARSKLQPFKRNDAASTKTREVDTWLPIHDWPAGQVWRTIHASGVPHHRAYDLGMPRLSCVFCIFSPRAGLQLAGKHNPALLDEYVKLERDIDHTFRADFSLADVQRDIADGNDTGPVEDWRM